VKARHIFLLAFMGLVIVGLIAEISPEIAKQVEIWRHPCPSKGVATSDNQTCDFYVNSDEILWVQGTHKIGLAASDTQDHWEMVTFIPKAWTEHPGPCTYRLEILKGNAWRILPRKPDDIGGEASPACLGKDPKKDPWDD
jgi:hypothetical protein